ncbi:hypothetical protein FB567DRAFT_581693 [Paraphoma chrysanthemicola]|uniref:Uncharacterized protein n=1 Tax=Paraphoma chrysanthemicola TaxID=798071 RepID=A0A8K0R1L2_9PLEO|nr:hypothetical protein FB567DRAFT_581693 [Paraphoma chrysanthemicola]
MKLLARQNCGQKMRKSIASQISIIGTLGSVFGQTSLSSAATILSTYNGGKSEYSGLPRNVSKELRYHSPYWSQDEATASKLWNQLEIHTGFVALHKSWTDKKSLPRGDSFPWDDSRTIYVLNVFHILHCLQMLRISIVESHHNQPQTMSYKHLQHCLNDLREDAMCNADDTPRYTHTWPDRVTGADGQLRQCRNFEALSTWARSNTACFSFSHRDDPSWNKTARFRHCPPDSPYLPAIRKTYGFGDDWLPSLEISPSWSHSTES